MSDVTKPCNANETAACCCVDVGTVMDMYRQLEPAVQ